MALTNTAESEVLITEDTRCPGERDLFFSLQIREGDKVYSTDMGGTFEVPREFPVTFLLRQKSPSGPPTNYVVKVVSITRSAVFSDSPNRAYQPYCFIIGKILMIEGAVPEQELFLYGIYDPERRSGIFELKRAVEVGAEMYVFIKSIVSRDFVATANQAAWTLEL